LCGGWTAPASRPLSSEHGGCWEPQRSAALDAAAAAQEEARTCSQGAVLPGCRRVYGEDAEALTFNFFPDVSQSPSVVRAMLQAQEAVPHAVAGVARVAARWRGFGTLWRGDRQAALAKLRWARGPAPGRNASQRVMASGTEVSCLPCCHVRAGRAS
jgi:hypothetical protein